MQIQVVEGVRGMLNEGGMGVAENETVARCGRLVSPPVPTLSGFQLLKFVL